MNQHGLDPEVTSKLLLKRFEEENADFSRACELLGLKRENSKYEQDLLKRAKEQRDEAERKINARNAAMGERLPETIREETQEEYEKRQLEKGLEI